MRLITQHVTNISLNSFGAEHYYGISGLGIIIGTYFCVIHQLRKLLSHSLHSCSLSKKLKHERKKG